MGSLLYFSLIVVTAVLSVALAFHARRNRGRQGALLFAWLISCQGLLAMTETLSMLSPSPETALFWFKTRYLFSGFGAVFWLVFAMEYAGYRQWLSKRFSVGLSAIPFLTQVMVWTSGLHGLWVKHEVVFFRSGPFWVADTSLRVAGLWFMVHTFYSYLLVTVSLLLLLVAAWRLKSRYRAQALLMSGAALTVVFFAFAPTFGLRPWNGFNQFTPGMGLGLLLVALAVFRFGLLKHPPAAGSPPETSELKLQARRSQAVFLLIFILSVSGIAAIGYMAYQRNFREFLEQTEAQMASVAELKKEELSGWRRDRLADTGVYFRNYAFSWMVELFMNDPTDAQARTGLKDWLDRLFSAGQYDRIFLLDTAGRERFSVPEKPGPVPEIVIGKIPALMKEGRTEFLDFYRDPDSGSIRLALLMPIYSVRSGPGMDRPLGCLVLRIDPEAHLFPYIRRWPVSNTSAETILLRREGGEVVYLNELKFRTDTALNLRYPLEKKEFPSVQAVLGREGIVEGADYRGVPAIAYLIKVPDSPWFLESRVDRSEVYSLFRKRLGLMIAVTVLLIMLSGAGLSLVWRRQRERYFRGQAETAAALKQSLERSELANRAAFNAIWDWDLQTGLTWWNENFIKLFGYGHGIDFLDMRSWIDNLHPEDRSRVETSLRETLGSARNVWSELYRVRHRDGHYLSVEDRRCIVRDASGAAVRMIGAIQDVTERHEAQAALEESEERYRLLTENAPIGIALCSGEKIVFANRTALRMLGAESEDMVLGHSYTEILHPDWVNDVKVRMERTMVGETGLFPAEGMYLKLDGTPMDCQFMASPIVLQGEPAMLIIISDITDRKRAESDMRAAQSELQRLLDEAVRSRRVLLSVAEDRKAAEEEVRKLNAELEERVRQRTAQLESVNRELEAFTYSVSHDLRAPLRAINGYTNILMEDHASGLDAEGKRICSVITESALNMGRLISGLLTLSRLGHKDMSFSSVDMKTMANSIFFELTTQEGRGRIDLRIGHLPPALGDVNLIREVWSNILANAIKFSGKKHRAVIEVDGVREDREVVYSVKDNGVGFDMAYANKLFGVFQRLHSEKDFEGTGVGLAIVQRIVGRHGGRVWAESTPGEGAVFYFTLPSGEPAGGDGPRTEGGS